MARVILVKGDGSPQIWISNGIHKRLTTSVAERAELVFTGMAEWNAGVPFVVSQETMDKPRAV